MARLAAEWQGWQLSGKAGRLAGWQAGGGSLRGRLAGWQAGGGSLRGRLAGWQAGRLAGDRHAGCEAGMQAERQAGRLAGWQAGRLAVHDAGSGRLAGRQAGRQQAG